MIRKLILAFAVLAALTGKALAQGVMTSCNNQAGVNVPLAAGAMAVGTGLTTCPQAQGGQGTWTPGLVGSTAAGAATFGTQVGSWEQIGRMVTLRFNIVSTALTSATGNLQISGLPFASANVTGDDGVCEVTVMAGVTLDTSYTTLSAVILPNTSVAALYENGSGQTGQVAPVGKFAAATTLIGKCQYHI